MKDKLLIIGAVLAIIFMYGGAMYEYGAQAEKTKQLELRDIAQKELDRKLRKALDDLSKKEKTHVRETAKLNDNIDKLQNDYNSAIADINQRHADELLNSSARADGYRRASEARAVELSELTGRYDRVIEDGRKVVERCARGIETRDGVIKTLVERIESDIRLYNES